MKKRYLSILFILIFNVCVFANVDKPRFLLGSGNDKFTYGIAKNADDGLSYSGVIEFDFDKYIVELNMKAFTDRGSWPDGKYRSGRLDGVFFDTVFQNNYKLKNNFSLDVNRTIGMGMAGNFRFDIVQNAHHKNVGVDSLSITYDWNESKVGPIYGLNLGLNYQLDFVEFSLNADYLATIGFISEKKGYFGFGMFNHLFDAQIGYKTGKNFSSSGTMDYVLDASRGLYVSYRMDASPFGMTWEYYPQTGFGFGTYYIDIIPMFSATKWNHTDFYFDHGQSRLYGMELLNACIKLPVSDNLDALLEIGYVSGFPKTQDSDVRIQRNYSLYQVGMYYCPVHWIISPFIQGQLGLGYFQLDYINSANPAKSDEIVSSPATLAFTSDIRLGFDLLPEGLLSFGNTSYKVQLYFGTHIFPGYSKLTEVIRLDNSHIKNWEATLFNPYFGLGVSIGIDAGNYYLF